MSGPVSPVAAPSTRFGVVSVLPTLLLVGWVAFLLASGAIAGEPDVGRLGAAISSASATQIGLALLAAFVGGTVLHPFQFPLVRLLEGYWDGVPFLRTLKMRRHRGQSAQDAPIAARRPKHRRLREFPTRGKGPPAGARLGNALRAGERRAGHAYGLDAVVMMPRLHLVASPQATAFIEDLRNQLDDQLATAWSSVNHSDRHSGSSPDGPWVFLPLGFAVLSVVSYDAAVRTALFLGRGLHARLRYRARQTHRSAWLALPNRSEAGPRPRGRAARLPRREWRGTSGVHGDASRSKVCSQMLPRPAPALPRRSRGREIRQPYL